VGRGLLAHMMMLQHFARKLARYPLPPLQNQGSDSAIVDCISAACATPRISSWIALLLVEDMRSSESQLTGLRATQTTVFPNGMSWTIVQWILADGTISLAIFHFEGSEWTEGSWLLHRGILPTTGQDHEGWRLPWEGEQVSWNVGELSHLKILFGVVQYTLGEVDVSGDSEFKDGEYGNAT
jgi:hypothetical protein